MNLNKEQIKKAQSLCPSPSMIWYGKLKDKFEVFNKHRRQDKMPEVSFKYWCYLNNIDLSGKKLIDITRV